ncbi:MAG: NifU family protein [Pseudobdellovibrionaceae bacterium]
MQKVEIQATPNPATMKFMFDKVLTEEPHDFVSAAEASRSPLASKIFGFPWASGVYIGRNFVTVTKQEWVDWDVLAEPLAGLIGEHIESGEPILAPLDTRAGEDFDENDSPIVQKIKEILNRDIRPVVALDGGDIAFSKYEEGILYIHMKGACSGCPSSTATLKQGIEVRIRELLPEVKEVLSI